MAGGYADFRSIPVASRRSIVRARSTSAAHTAPLHSCKYRWLPCPRNQPYLDQEVAGNLATSCHLWPRSAFPPDRPSASSSAGRHRARAGSPRRGREWRPPPPCGSPRPPTHYTGSSPSRGRLSTEASSLRALDSPARRCISRRFSSRTYSRQKSSSSRGASASREEPPGRALRPPGG